MTDFDRDKFANDFEEEHGWCPDAGYDIKQWGDITVEPKDYWYIDTVNNGVCHNTNPWEVDIDDDKEIGNYFKTEEEAKKAVEKLKAWKRLENKEFKFDGYDVAHNSNGNLCGQLFYNAGDCCIEEVEKDLDLLFGGEE